MGSRNIRDREGEVVIEAVVKVRQPLEVGRGKEQILP